MSTIEQKVQAILQEMEEYIASHGGAISLTKIENNIVYVRLQGTCQTCPLSFYTLTMGLEKQIQRVCPEIQRVIADDE